MHISKEWATLNLPRHHGGHMKHHLDFVRGDVAGVSAGQVARNIEAASELAPSLELNLIGQGGQKARVLVGSTLYTKRRREMR